MSQPPSKPKIPFYWWPFWMFLLALCLFVFYVVFTPVWIGIRLAAWLSERRPRSAAARRRASVGAREALAPTTEPASGQAVGDSAGPEGAAGRRRRR
jgi:hypothetical protein